MSESTTTVSQRGNRSLVEHIEWQWAVAYGAGAWVVSLLATYAVVAVAGVAETDIVGSDHGAVDVAAWILHGSIGGTVELGRGALGSLPRGVAITSNYPILQYATLDSNVFGAAVFAHYLLPAVVTAVAGSLLAARSLPETQGGLTAEDRRRGLLGGVSLAVGFALLTIGGTVVFDASSISYDSSRLLLAAFVYPVVFGGVGAAVRTGVGSRSLVAFLLGVVGFALGLGLFVVVEDPATGAYDMLFDGLVVDLMPVLMYETGHGIGSAFLPEWYVLVPLLLAGAVVAKLADSADPLAGAGAGARIAWGYAPLAFFGAAAWVAAYMDELLNDTSMTREELVVVANQLGGGIVPEATLVAGILWPTVLGAVGGAVLVFVEDQRTGTTRRARDGQE